MKLLVDCRRLCKDLLQNAIIFRHKQLKPFPLVLRLSAIFLTLVRVAVPGL